MVKIQSRHEIKCMPYCIKSNNAKTLILFVIISSISIAQFYLFITKDVSNLNVESINTGDSNIVYAQMNSPTGSSTTILGDIVIPPNSNGTMTTAANNTDESNSPPTAINKTLVAQNVTSAVNILREDRTFPISPTGISTQGLQQPPDHRIINNSNIPVNR